MRTKTNKPDIVISWRDIVKGRQGPLHKREFSVLEDAMRFAHHKFMQGNNFSVWVTMPYGTEFALTAQFGLVIV